ncbi:hypothetical protein CL622_04025 [archaeon]|nr:hypothetical protein [archaeon]|tara:strand:- start:589 stop:1707 length:1119 start_codon:yes stop_codon:yes gene_type:complete
MAIIGVDLGATNVRAAAVDLKTGRITSDVVKVALYGTKSRNIITRIMEVGHRVNNVSIDTELALTIFTDSIKNIFSAIDEVKANVGNVQGIGIGSPGPLNPETGIIGPDENALPPNLWGWNSVNLIEMISQRYGVAAKVNGDVRIQAQGEHKYGAGKGLNTFLMLAPGTGCGAGIIEDGKLKNGGYHSAGEVWKIPVYRPELGMHKTLHIPQIFDHYGAIEGVARILIENVKAKYLKGVSHLQDGSTLHIDEMAKEHLTKLFPEVNAKNIADAADANHNTYEYSSEAHTLAKRAFNDYGTTMGRVLSGPLAAMNAEALILGGKGGLHLELFKKPLEEALRGSIIYADKLEVKKATLDENQIGIIGSASLFSD